MTTHIALAARLISRLFNMSDEAAEHEARLAFETYPSELVTDAAELTYKERLQAERDAEGWRPVA